MFKLNENEIKELDKLVMENEGKSRTMPDGSRQKKDCGSNCSGKCGESCQAACKSSCTGLF